MIDETTFMLNGFCLLPPIVPHSLDVRRMCSFERFLRRGIKINEPDFRKDVQGFRVFDNTICRQAADQRVRNRVGNGSYQSHPECHESDWDAGKQEHPAFESPDARVT